MPSLSRERILPVVPMPLKKTRKDPSTNCRVFFEFVNTLVEESADVDKFVDVDEFVDDDEFDGVGVVVGEFGIVVGEFGVVVAELGVVVGELGVERTKVLDIVAPA